MSDTYHYKNVGQKIADKRHLSKFLKAIGATPNALRLDSCECWTVRGRFGYAATWGDGQGFLLVFVGEGRPKQWTYDKKRLHFCRVTVDGHDEGTLHLDHLPTAEEGKAIRTALGIRKEAAYSEADRARASARARVLNASK